MPKGTEVHVGFFVPQSKQTYIQVQSCCEGEAAAKRRHLVGRLRFELVEDFDRLTLGSQTL